MHKILRIMQDTLNPISVVNPSPAPQPETDPPRPLPRPGELIASGESPVPLAETVIAFSSADDMDFDIVSTRS